MKIVMKHILCCLCAFAVVLAAAGCSKDPKTSTAAPGTLPVIGPDTSLPAESTAPSSSAEQTMPSTEKTTEAPVTEIPTTAPTPTTMPTACAELAAAEATPR